LLQVALAAQPAALLDVLRESAASDPYYAEILERLDGLARSIAAEGVLQPIQVVSRGGRLIVRDGHRRCLASLLAGRDAVPAVQGEEPSELTAVAHALIVNLQREDLTALEKGAALLRLALLVAQRLSAENAEAVTEAEIVILSVPFRSQSETLTNLKGALREGQLVVDATVPLAAAVSGKATRTLGVWQGSAAQQAQEMVPDGVRVVSAFHTVSAALLTDLDHEFDEDVLLCGDRREDKARVKELVNAIRGLRAVDCGPLEMARLVEGLTPLIISINVRHKARAGIRITGLDVG